MKRIAALLLVVFGLASLSPATAQPRRETPYWASIASGEAMMRRGPGRTYPGEWLYVRADLPIRVIEVYQDWRKIEDPDGTQGWMLVSLLSDTRTAIVRGTEPAASNTLVPVMVSMLPSGLVTVTDLPLPSAPVPSMMVIFFDFMKPLRLLTMPSTIFCLRACATPKSTDGVPALMPKSAAWGSRFQLGPSCACQIPLRSGRPSAVRGAR